MEWTPAQKSLCVQPFLQANYYHIVGRYGCGVPPLTTLCTWANKVIQGEPLADWKGMASTQFSAAQGRRQF